MGTVHVSSDTVETDPETRREDTRSSAYARAAELGFCPLCLELGQYVPTLPRAGTCRFHATAGNRPESHADASTPEPAPLPIRPLGGATRPPGGPRGGKFAGPRSRRRSAAAPLPDGRFRPPHTVAVVCALPAGSRRAHDQADALDALEGVEQLLELRGDRQATVGAVWRALVCRADYATRTVTLAWAELEQETGRSRATVGRALRWLRDVGLLGVVHTGASKGAIGGEVNRVPTYVLAVPALESVDEIEPPTGPLGSVDRLRTRARAERLEPHGRSLRSDDLKSAPKTRAQGPDWILSVVPVTGAERLEACERLRWDAVTLRPVSGRMLRHLLREVFDVGWSPRDVLYALDHKPTGEAWRYAGMPRAVAAWIGFRLAAWRSPAGGWLPSRAQLAGGHRVAGRPEGPYARAGARAEAR